LTDKTILLILPPRKKGHVRAKEKTLLNHIQGSTLVVVPDAGRLPQVDNPETFLEEVLPFLG